MGRKKTPVFLNPESVWGNVCWWVFHQCWPDYLPANSSSQSSKESVRFPGIPVLAERLMFLSQGCWPAVMLDRIGSSLSQLEWKGRIVVVCIDVTDTGSKKGTEKKMKIYLVHYYYYEPFYWIEVRFCSVAAGKADEGWHGKWLLSEIAWQTCHIDSSHCLGKTVLFFILT